MNKLNAYFQLHAHQNWYASLDCLS